MKKIERCQVRDFHHSIFLQTKKMIKIHTFTPIFLYHIAVARTFSQKKKLAHSMRMYGHRKLRKKRKKKQKLRIELFKGLRLSELGSRHQVIDSSMLKFYGMEYSYEIKLRHSQFHSTTALMMCYRLILRVDGNSALIVELEKG